jgi:hypothetical protein
MSRKTKKYVNKNRRVTQKHRKNNKTQKYVKRFGKFTRKYFFKGGAKKVPLDQLIKFMSTEEKIKFKKIIKKLNLKKNIYNYKKNMTEEEKHYLRYYSNKFKSYDFILNDFKNQKKIDDEKIKIIINIAEKHIETMDELEAKLIEKQVANKDLDDEEYEKEFYINNSLSKKIEKDYPDAQLEQVRSFLEEYISLEKIDKQIHYLNNNNLMKEFIDKYNKNYEGEEGFEKVSILPNSLLNSIISDIDNLLRKSFQSSSRKSSSRKSSSRKSSSRKSSSRKSRKNNIQPVQKTHFVKPLSNPFK